MGELLGNFPEFTVQFFRKVVLLVQSEIKNSIKVRTDLAAGISFVRSSETKYLTPGDGFNASVLKK